MRQLLRSEGECTLDRGLTNGITETHIAAATAAAAYEERHSNTHTNNFSLVMDLSLSSSSL
jgi:hypothetical protein